MHTCIIEVIRVTTGISGNLKISGNLAKVNEKS